MPQKNYRQAKRHREETRKKRQDEKRQRKLNRPDEPAAAPAADTGAEVKEAT